MGKKHFTLVAVCVLVLGIVAVGQTAIITVQITGAGGRAWFSGLPVQGVSGFEPLNDLESSKMNNNIDPVGTWNGGDIPLGVLTSPAMNGARSAVNIMGNAVAIAGATAATGSPMGGLGMATILFPDIRPGAGCAPGCKVGIIDVSKFGLPAGAPEGVDYLGQLLGRANATARRMTGFTFDELSVMPQDDINAILRPLGAKDHLDMAVGMEQYDDVLQARRNTDALGSTSIMDKAQKARWVDNMLTERNARMALSQWVEKMAPKAIKLPPKPMWPNN